jgi:hypothetical protein
MMTTTARQTQHPLIRTPWHTPDSVTYTLVMWFQNMGTNKDISSIYLECPTNTFTKVTFDDGTTSLPKYGDNFYTKKFRYKWADGMIHSYSAGWKAIETDGNISDFETFDPIVLCNVSKDQVDTVEVFFDK